MIITSLVSIKIVTALAKDMVNWELAKRVIPNLYYAGEVIVQNAEAAIEKHRAGRQKNDNDSIATNQHASSSTEYLVHNKLEALFAWFQVIVLWHDPYNSLIAISSLLTSFLLLTYFAPSFYATIMIALFVYNSTKLWFRHIWPEIRVPPSPEKEVEARLDIDRWTYLHPDLMTLREFGQIISNLIKAFIGNRISDTSLLFSITTTLVLAPGIYLFVLPRAAKEFLGKLINRKTGIEIVKNLEEDKSSKEEEEPDVVSTQPSNLESIPNNSSLSSTSSTSSSLDKLQDESNLINFNDNEAEAKTNDAHGHEQSITEPANEDDDGFVML